MNLRRKIFFRITALIVLLTIGIGLGFAVLTVRHHRNDAITTFKVKVNTRAHEIERLMDRGDRKGLNSILRALVHSDRACTYASIEKDGKRFLRFPPGPGVRPPERAAGPAPDKVSVRPFKNGEGAVLFDVATAAEDGMVLHAVLSRRLIDVKARPVLGMIAVFCLCAIVMGVVLAAIFSRRAMAEVDRLTEGLRVSEDKFKKVFYHTPAWVVIASLEDDRYMEVNEGFLRASGYRREEVIGRTSLELGTWIDPEERGEVVGRIKEKGRVQNMKVKRRMKDGRVRAMLLSGEIMEIAGEACILSVSLDVTDWIETRKALEESERRYRLLVENATDVIFIAQSGKLRFFNPRAEALTGYSGEELAKMHLEAVIHPEDREMVVERHLGRLRGEKLPSRYTFRALTKSGQTVSVELTTVLIDWEGKPATLNFMRDITRQKKLEAQFHQAQRMESMGTLAGGIAHDFNNLLMAIQGRTSMMLMNKNASHPDFDHLRGIEDHVESAAELTRQLLGFARGGKYEVSLTDLNELIGKQNRMFGRTRKEITMRADYQEDLWPVAVDRGQIMQVLLNLYINACQAMPGGGEIFVETHNVVLGEEYVQPFFVEPGRYVKITVTDTGVGMDKKTQEKIFDPFFTTKKMGRGTGLGLASAYGIIKNHGGFINVYSEKGHGSTFTIHLPASEGEVVESTTEAGDPLRGSETVLVVDDEEMIVEIGAEILKRLGYRVMTARGGKEAVEVYEKNREKIDMVILDMVMPGMSGGETFDRIKKIDPGVRVLLSSGYSVNGQAREILDRGCNGFIQKPFKMKELSRKMREVLDA